MINLNKEELYIITKLFEKMDELFFEKTERDAEDYKKIRFERESNYRYFEIKYKDICFEIYYYDNRFNFKIYGSKYINEEVLQLIKYIKKDCRLIFDKTIEDGKMINLTFEQGDKLVILLNRSRRRNNMV